MILTKKPKQYVQVIDELKQLLGKVKVKVEKGKGVRQRKKDKVKEKLQSGEYLPKEVYEIQRQARLEVLAEKMKKEGKTLNLGKKKDAKSNDKRKEFAKNKKEKEAKFAPRDGYKGRDKGVAGSKEPRAFKGESRDNKGRGAAGKFEKKPFKKFDKDEQKFGENKWTDKQKSKKDFNDKVKDRKSLTDDNKKDKTLHPSWEAKKQQRDMDAVKFTQNEVFEF